MPYLIETPECWFRTNQRDIYELSYDVPENFFDLSAKAQKRIQTQYRKESRKLTAWFESNLPEITLTILGPSEYSGYILGGPTMKVADFDEKGLEVFNAHWRDKQPWKIIVHSFAEWAQRLSNVHLLSAPADPEKSCSWWDTPEGIVLLSADQNGKLLSRYDASWLLNQLRPNLAKAEEYAYPYGEYHANTDHPLLIIGYGSPRGPEWSGDKYIKDKRRLSQLREALGLTASHKVRQIVDDF